MPPYERNVNTVFQDYALFPHMTVLENVAYGPRVRGVRAGRTRARARGNARAGAARRRRASGARRSSPAASASAWRWRARSINQPKVLLLDEPLGALDLKLREEMQIELKSLQQKLGITFVYVTHDQGEALSMADRVAVFNKGRIEQLAAPRELYLRPADGLRGAFRRQRQCRRAAALAQKLRRAAQPFAVRAENIDVLAESAAAPAGRDGRARRGARRAVPRRRQPLAGAARCRRGVECAGCRRRDAPHCNGLAVGARVRLAWPRDGRRAARIGIAG